MHPLHSPVFPRLYSIKLQSFCPPPKYQPGAAMLARKNKFIIWGLVGDHGNVSFFKLVAMLMLT